MRKVLEIGGVVAAAVLIAFGIAAIVMGFDGRSTVNTTLQNEQIYGTADMSPDGIAPAVKRAQDQQAALFKKLDAANVKLNGETPVPSPITTPGCTVAKQLVDNGDEARCFGEYMRIHTFESTSGLTYSQMGQYVANQDAPFKFTDGIGGTNYLTYAKFNPKTQQPVSNGRRDLWVTYTALTTALNASYMASQISLFGIVVGVALLLSGVGFAILAISGALRSPEPAFKFLGRWAQKDKKGLAPSA